MKRNQETTSVEVCANSTAKKSIIIPIVLIIVFIIALYFFSICIYGGMKYTTSDYYNTLIHKFEVSDPHEKAVAEAKIRIAVLRGLVAFSGLALVGSVTGIILCVKTIIKRKKMDRDINT